MVGDGLTPAGRVFAALIPPIEIALALAERLGEVPIPGRLVPSTNWHITLRFVGFIEELAYERWLGALDQIGAGTLNVQLRGLGAFPQARSATVLWAGVEGPGISSLATAIDEATQMAGFPAEERPFRPHLTLARVRPPADVRALTGDEALGPPGLKWRARQFHVMSAVGGRHQIHETFQMG